MKKKIINAFVKAANTASACQRNLLFVDDLSTEVSVKMKNVASLIVECVASFLICFQLQFVVMAESMA